MQRVSPPALGVLAFGLLFLGMGPLARAGEAAPQWRAFWVDAFNPGIKTPEQVDQLVADVKALNCNTIIAQVRKRGDAYHRKTIDPFADDPEVPEDFDPLADLLEKAHRHGIQVHAWINPMPIWRGSDPPPRSEKHLFHRHGPETKGRDNWLTSDEEGQTRFPVGYFLDAGHPDVANHLARVVADLITNYPVDGIHLDYIRYPETESGSDRDGYGVGYNPLSVERFNRVHGTEGVPARNAPAWSAWRRQQVTQLVRRLRVTALETNPQVIFSAALIPWGDGPGADETAWEKTAPFTRVFQDWHAWRQEGLLDVIVPMNYDREADPRQKAYFRNWVQFERMYRYRCRLIVGLGAYLNSVPHTLEQLRVALAETDDVPAADGVSFYSYAAFRQARAGGRRPTLDDLRQALVVGQEGEPSPPFALPAPLPDLPRIRRPLEGTLAGFATDARGQPLDTRDVRIEPPDGGEVRTVKTDGNGFWAVLYLKPGRYRVVLPDGKEKIATVEAGKVARLGSLPATPAAGGD